LGEPWWLPPLSAIDASSHASRHTKRVEKYLEIARAKIDSDRIEALQDIVDAIRVVDAKLKRPRG